MTQLAFHGAAETVTGSKYLLTAGGASVLVDSGLFQGLKDLRERNWQPLAFDPAALQAVLLTHAHIDHLGFLPRLVKMGGRMPVYCTTGTADLARIMLIDAAKNQEDDAEYANRRGHSKHHPALPLFDERDAEQALALIEGVPRGKWFSPQPPIWCRFHDTGHLLGSALIEVEIRDTTPPTRIVFSGDVGRYNAPLYHDPQPPPPCDYLICESTYGDREHPDERPLDQICDIIQAARARGGVVVVPSFAVGRAQQLIYLIQVLIESGRLPEMPIYLDSPMSVDATRIYTLHGEDHDLSEGQLANTLGGRRVHLVRSTDDSKRINAVRGPAVIISSSGMMTGGRILLGGFMAAGTRGRLLQEGATRLRIHGQDIPVRAKVASMSALSGHADRSELLRWLEQLPTPRQVFLTHGERSSAQALADTLRRTRGWNVHVPFLGEAVELAPPTA